MDDRPFSAGSVRRKQRSTGIDLETEARISELKSMRLSIQKTRFRMELVITEIDEEIEKLLKKIEGILNSYDTDDNQRDRRFDLHRDSIYGEESIEASDQACEGTRAVPV